MRAAFLAMMCLTCLPIKTFADDAISTKTLAAIKRATVFVKVQSEGLSASGSGFVMKVDGPSALIVTNHHVIEPKFQVIVPGGPRVLPKKSPKTKRPRPLPVPKVYSTSPRALILTLKNASVTVVFESGTKNERAVKAEILAADPQRDLAVLRVQDVKNLPEPIDFSKALELTETMTVFTFGFPFGKSLSTSKGNPAITVGKAAISSLRQDDEGELALVQIDGNLNPGNSGGPVVDSSGRLIGVAVAIIRDSNGIAFAIPGADLRKMALGRLGTYHLISKETNQDKTAVDVEVGMIDPLNKIPSVTLLYIPASQARGKTEGIKSLEAFPGCRKLPLTIEKQLASGKMVLENTAREKEWLLQAKYVNGSGKEVKTRVVRHQVTALAVVKERPKDPFGGFKGSEPGKGVALIIRGDMFAFLEEAVKDKRLAEVDISGFKLSKDQYRDCPADGGLLIGFQIGLGKFFDKQIVNALRPIYRTKAGEKMGEWVGKPPTQSTTVKAKEGYVIGGINLKAGLLIDGLSLTFMKLDKDRLKVDESYTSDWIGSQGGNRATIGGRGSFFVGICGHLNNDRAPCSLGLITVLAKADPKGTDPGPKAAGKVPEWTVDLTKMKYPETAAAGKLLGKDFTVEAAKLDPVALTLRQGNGFFPDAAIILFLGLKQGESIEGKTYEIPSDTPAGTPRPAIHLKRIMPGQKLPTASAFLTGYAMKLEFGKAQDGAVTGKIYVCLPDPGRSVVAGTFTLKLR